MRISYVDVFTTVPFAGNGLAVVHDADDLSTREMQAIAAWTNLSETTFLLAPTRPGADYRVRIFTTGTELPFAGHPTLGSAYAWLAAGGVPAGEGLVVQECGAGLVPVRAGGDVLAFAAPPLTRSGPLDEATTARVLSALRLSAGHVEELFWCDNGPGWIGVRMASAQDVLAVEPDRAAFDHLAVGLVGPYAAGEHPDGADVEVRAFYADGMGFEEDPVTGSLNAALGQTLVASGALPTAYLAAQGTVLGRAGRVHLEQVGGDLWVGGSVRPVVTGPLGGTPGALA